MQSAKRLVPSWEPAVSYFQPFSTKIEGNYRNGLFAPGLHRHQRQRIQFPFQRDPVAALSVFRHMEQFKALAPQGSHQTELAAQTGRHMEHRGVQPLIRPHGALPLHIGALQGPAVNVAGKDQMDAF